MLVHVPKVLTPDQVAACRALMERAAWDDGRVTAGAQSAQVKDNQQVREGSAEAKGYTFAALATSDKLLREQPEAARAAVRAVKAAQVMLKSDFGRATVVGRKRFPPDEAGLIAELIRRDVPFYSPDITEQAVESMNRFARDIGLLSRPVPYREVVAAP